MANTKPVDKSKKSNFRCTNCSFYKKFEGYRHGVIVQTCTNSRSEKHGLSVNYWSRCKKFEWSPLKTYVAEPGCEKLAPKQIDLPGEDK